MYVLIRFSFVFGFPGLGAPAALLYRATAEYAPADTAIDGTGYANAATWTSEE